MFAEKTLSISGYTNDVIPKILATNVKDAAHCFNVNTDFKQRIIEFFHLRKFYNELIVIHGDYDVDGMTGAAILYQFLKDNGFNCVCFLPTREDGYGLSEAAVNKYIDLGARVVITADCGISNKKEANMLYMAGIDLVITDHHTPPSETPRAKFILHPRFLNDVTVRDFSGAGMAYYFCHILRDTYSVGPINDLLDLVVIGLVGDMVPLREECFLLAKQGLLNLRETDRVGLCALIKECGLKKASITSDELAFQIIPRLNAAGRMKDPQIALRLLLTEDEKEARAISKELTQLNNERKILCDTVYNSVVERIQKEDCVRSVVMGSADWPHGVLGIVCARVVENFDVPAYLMQIKNGVAKGSARAPEGISIIASLNRAGDFMTKYGGHVAAGGFSAPEKNIPMIKAHIDDFLEENEEFIIGKKERPVFIVTNSYINEDLIKDLDRLEPFGMGNPKPLFSIAGINLNCVPDKNSKHIYANAQITSNKAIKAVGWNMWNDGLLGKKKVDITFDLCFNRFKGKEDLCMNIHSISDSVDCSDYDMECRIIENINIF